MVCLSSRPKWQLTLILLMLLTSCRSEITITNNAYSGILIAINDGVGEDPSLLQGIKDAFTEASKFLYEITGNRTYFSSISILLPPSWSLNLVDETAGNERFENSHFRIHESISDDDPPSVFRTSAVCGESEGHGLFAPAHFTSNQSFTQMFGSYGKQIVYQWARTRFGVFDERPQGDEPLLYPVNFGEDLEGSRCSRQIPGQKRKLTDTSKDCSITDAETDNCIFIPDEEADGVFASLMYDRSLDHVSMFCDTEGMVSDPALLHNPDPTNAQNDNCRGQSIWEVIRDHPDHGHMDPSLTVASTVPTFRIIRVTASTVVSVLDTSGSMDGARIQKLSQGTTFFLQNVVQNGIECGIVRFSATAETLQGIIEMTDNTRQQLIDAVPTVVGGYTSIGSGIALALTMLDTANTHGGILIVVSDGEENRDPTISDVYQRVQDAGVVIFTVAISDNADTALESLAQSTGGNAYFTLDDDTSNAITEAFLDIGKHLTTGAGQGSNAAPIALFSEATTFNPSETTTGNVFIENTLGLNTEISFDYANSQGVDISLTSPNGSTYDITSNECTLALSIQIIFCKFPGVSETGNWQYTVRNKASRSQRVSVIFRSQARDPNDPPIVARAFWAITGDYTIVPGTTQRIFATVSKGLNAVIGANVTAIVETGTGGPATLQLEDGGTRADQRNTKAPLHWLYAGHPPLTGGFPSQRPVTRKMFPFDDVIINHGADLNKDDGIYSSFFTKFQGDGRYTVKIIVNGDGATSTSLQTILGVPSSASGSSRRRKRATSQTTGQFQRVASGGTFRALGTAGSTPFPPGRIRDLRVLSTDTSKYQATLQWTAQGSELDVGAASEYEIRRSLDRNLSANYSVIMPGDVVTGDLSAPATAGTVEKFTVQLPTGDNTTYFLGIVPKVASAAADISNVVSLTTRSITLASLGVTTTQAPTTTESPTTTQVPTTTQTPTTIEPTTTQVLTTTETLTTTQTPTTTEPPTTTHVQTTTDPPTTTQVQTTTDPPTTPQATTTAQVPTTTQPTTVPVTSESEYMTTQADVATTSLAPTTNMPTTGTDDSTASPSSQTSASTPVDPMTIGLVTVLIVVAMAIGVGVACFPKKNGRFFKVRRGHGQALPVASPYGRTNRPPVRYPTKRPRAYYPHPYNMNGVYKDQGFLSAHDVYGRAQSMPSKPRSSPTYAYDNVDYWYHR